MKEVEDLRLVGISVMVTERDKERLQAAARRDERTLSTWARLALLRAAASSERDDDGNR